MKQSKTKKDIKTPFSNSISPRLDYKYLFKISNNSISITDGVTRLKCNYQSRFNLDNSNIKTGTLVYNKKHDRLFLHVTYEVPCIDKTNTHSNIISCDIGVKTILAFYHNSSNSYNIYHDEITLNKIRKIRNIKSKLQSKGTRSASRRFASMSRRETQLRRQLDHDISKSLVELCYANKIDTIVLEDLTNYKSSIKKNTKSKSTNRELSSWPYFRLQSYIEYKSNLYGIHVVKVDPRNTSITCPTCNHISKDNRPTRDTFTCVSCGITAYSDYIAALNIYRRFLGYA